MLLFNAYNVPHIPIETDTPSAHIDEATADTIYIAWEESTSVDQFIEQTLKVSNVTTIGYALGAWTARAGLTYVPYHSFRGE